jgi:hypothetical protein
VRKDDAGVRVEVEGRPASRRIRTSRPARKAPISTGSASAAAYPKESTVTLAVAVSGGTCRRTISPSRTTPSNSDVRRCRTRTPSLARRGARRHPTVRIDPHLDERVVRAGRMSAGVGVDAVIHVDPWVAGPAEGDRAIGDDRCSAHGRTSTPGGSKRGTWAILTTRPVCGSMTAAHPRRLAEQDQPAHRSAGMHQEVSAREKARGRRPPIAKVHRAFTRQRWWRRLAEPRLVLDVAEVTGAPPLRDHLGPLRVGQGRVRQPTGGDHLARVRMRDREPAVVGHRHLDRNTVGAPASGVARCRSRRRTPSRCPRRVPR